MTEQFVFILMISAALFIVISRNLKYAVVGVGVFSLLASFCYLVFHAPDVAIAEAIIGSALSTILYIVALKKYHTFYIYITSNSKTEINDIKRRFIIKDVVSKVIEYCLSHELQVQCVYTWDTPEKIARDHVYDLILFDNNDKVTIYGLETEIHVHNIEDILRQSTSKERFTFAMLPKEDIDEDI